jgi:benzil reductase ((S)-benzoin forming)
MNVAIVSGVSRGLGEAIAFALLARGFHVLGIGRSSAARLRGERYRFVAIDLGNVDAIDGVLEAPFEALASLQPAMACLVNNAATPGPVGVAGKLSAADVASSLMVNLAAPAVLVNLFCRVFQQATGNRRIVNVSSGAAVNAIPGIGVYSSAKSGLEMLTQVVAAEQGKDGIRCISLRPGIIDTAMQAFVRAQRDDVLPSVGMFKGFHESGQLVAPDTAAGKIVDKVVLGPIEQGRAYSYQDL